jgi:hypothetical protein
MAEMFTTLELSKVIPESFFENINEAQEQLKQLNLIADKLQHLGIKVNCSFEMDEFYSKLTI